MSQNRKPPERRAVWRTPVAIDAVLYYNALMLLECYVRDLSPEGAFIAISGHFLPDQAEVDLALNVPGAGGVPRRFSARVMRSTEEGAGLRLQNIDPVTLRNLMETLYSK